MDDIKKQDLRFSGTIKHALRWTQHLVEKLGNDFKVEDLDSSEALKAIVETQIVHKAPNL